jgi:hypothetical protein
MKDRPFLISGILGLGVVMMTLLLSAVGPRPAAPLPAGFITPVLAFEFAQSPDEVSELFDLEGSLAAMDRVNRWDFLYMALYSGCLFTFALTCARLTGRRFFYLPAALALLLLFADAMENVQLLAITRLLAERDVVRILEQLTPSLNRLRLFTWLKWGGLCVYFLLLIPYFRGLHSRWRWVWLVGALPALLAIVALFARGLPNELMALAIGLLFVLLTIYAWRFRQLPSADSRLTPQAN